MKRLISIALALTLVLALASCGREKGPDRLRELLEEGDALLEEQDFAGAERAYRDALEEDETSVSAWLGLADALEGAGEIDAAVEALREGLEITGSARIRSMLEKLTQGQEDGDQQGDDPETPETLRPELARELAALGYIGDSEKSRLYDRYAGELAGKLLELMEQVYAKEDELEQGGGEIWYMDCQAALFDAGDGVPGMLFAGGQTTLLQMISDQEDPVEEMCFPGGYSVWHFPQGVLTQYEDFDPAFAVGDGWALVGGYAPDGTGYDGKVVTLKDGEITDQVITQAWADFMDGETYKIDGAEADEEAFTAWTEKWDFTAAASVGHASDVSIPHTGLVEAEKLLAFLIRCQETEDKQDDFSVRDVDYEIVSTTDPRSDADATAYYQRPEFQSDLPGIRKINDFFRENEENLLREEGIFEYAGENTTGEAFFSELNVDAVELEDRIVSVCVSQSWWSGGNTDSGQTGYVFDAETGERLKLSDVLDVDARRLRYAVTEGLLRQTGGSGEDLFLNGLLYYTLDDYDFAIIDGLVTILFDKYEVASGAAGTFAVPVELPRKM